MKSVCRMPSLTGMPLTALAITGPFPVPRQRPVVIVFFAEMFWRCESLVRPSWITSWGPPREVARKRVAEKNPNGALVSPREVTQIQKKDHSLLSPVAGEFQSAVQSPVPHSGIWVLLGSEQRGFMEVRRSREDPFSFNQSPAALTRIQ